MTYRTCQNCVFEGQHCAERDKVREQLSGLGVRSIKWACKWRRQRFAPGDHVTAELKDLSDEFFENDYTLKYHAIVVKIKGSRAIIYVEPGTPDETCAQEFEARSESNGHCKVPLSRLTKRDETQDYVCHDCRSITRLHGHADHGLCTWYSKPRRALK